MTSAAQTLSSASAAAARTLAGVRDQVHRVIVGQDVLIDRLLVGFLCGGHVLVEGVPGLAKTLTVSSLARAMHLSSVRIQFTPDLLPADLIGTEVFSGHDVVDVPGEHPCQVEDLHPGERRTHVSAGTSMPIIAAKLPAKK